MILKEYKKILKDNDIILYDSIYRITFFRLIKLTKNIENRKKIEKKQSGGSNNLYFNPLINIKRKSKNDLNKILDYLINKDYEKIIYIFKLKKNINNINN